ncbi:hypothetical protein EYZ11_006285 [Aspergillus tanneri]|uniref:Oxidoreductase AflY n=1 Tax=Aspergillus tanneri TaxID=1220188 RepID=A0A4V3UP96_9EURO|nr:uncharacterized protein ATNIH1004_008013 [Aspergillus tanneri]KAA8646580.1 hypothetical protein ATNIH1004_008013 [Aspergillus tanneri]THC94234.1 hypothetical protein EYZ11_006285 [Aspergillus tanneri]
MATPSQISLLANHSSTIARVNKAPQGSTETASRLLQKNHDENHIFWRAVAGHNHVAHSVLTTFALGGGPAELQRAFDDGNDIQQPLPAANSETINQLSDPDHFRAHIGQLDQYANFLAFFSQRIESNGYRSVVQEYVFSGNGVAETMFAQLFEGLYHPVIHLALGIEFDQPAIVAEALAQAASHDSMGFEKFLFRAEALSLASSPNSDIANERPLVQLFQDIWTAQPLRDAARGFKDGPSRVREGVLGRTREEITTLAAQFTVDRRSLQPVQRRLAEMFSVAAYVAGAAQQPGKPRKIDFFHLHTITAALSVSVLVQQEWIPVEVKARLVEWKARTDLVWYAASGAVELRLGDLLDYVPGPSADIDWRDLYTAVTMVHDDGHLAKFVRGLKHGEEVSRPFEEGDENGSFPIKEEIWLKIAQLAYDSTVDRPIERKWIWGIGFEENWSIVLSREA